MTSISPFKVHYCFFCFKANDPKSSSSSSSKPPSSLFFKNIQRFHRGNPKLQKLFQCHANDNNFRNLVEGVCSDCAHLIGKANALTNEISVLQLKLQWESKKLHEVMRLAAKVSGRVKEYQDYLEKEIGEDGTERHLLTQTVSDFRKNVASLLKKVVKTKNPKVCIKRVACFIKQEQMESTSDNYDDSSDANEEKLNVGDDGCSFATDIQDELIEQKVDCSVMQKDNVVVKEGDDDASIAEVQTEYDPPVTQTKVCNQEDDFEGKSMESVPTPEMKLASLLISKKSGICSRGIRNKICPFEGCKERFELDAELEVHLRHHGNFPCNFCDESFTRVEKLVYHELQKHSHPSGRGVKCARCRRILIAGPKKSYAKVRHYMNLHLDISFFVDEGNVQCHICGRRFKPSMTRYNKKNLKAHIETEHNIQGKDEKSIFRCEKCNAPFLTDYQKLKHLRKEHNTAKWYCSACDLAFTSNLTYRTHQRKAHGSIEFKCTIPGCGILFPSKPKLDLHLGSKGHKGRTEMLKCSKCEKLFLNEINLNRHGCPTKRKVHVYKEVCEKCGKVFKGLMPSYAKQKLKVHHESHLEDYSANWQFACEICGKKCQNTFCLEQHKRTHSKAKPFLCCHCGRGFSIEYNMKRHLKLVHKVVVPLGTKRIDYDSIPEVTAD